MKQGTRITRILVVDDHPAILESIEILTRHEDRMRVVGTAVDAMEAIAEAKKLRPDLILMDVRMPGRSGVDAAREIRSFNPEVKILFYSGFPEAMLSALSIGAQGFILKGNSVSFLMAAIKAVIKGGICIDVELWPQILYSLRANSNLNRVSLLTPEEQQVARLLVTGKISKEIAHTLLINVRRVEKIRSNLFRKLGVRNAVELAFHLSTWK